MAAIKVADEKRCQKGRWKWPIRIGTEKFKTPNAKGAGIKVAEIEMTDFKVADK